ncbi:nuclear transport factor 2 family protein [Nonomuraea sp. NPDC050556]|uniref:nuclear transport factor 2 family protein n=1 Tax=Nonomuraea sp. NPDC050556 TaxID=3364369 RepID=UPI0037A79EDA
MTSSQIVLDALNATATGDTKRITELYAEDCTGWTAGTAIGSRDELLSEAEGRGEGLSDITMEASPIELPDGSVVAEWRMTAVHTGTLFLDDDLSLPATHRPLDLRGAMFAEIQDGQIQNFRQYWDEADLLEQLGLLGE